MNPKQFIKVSKDGKTIIVPDVNRAFYLSQGATITTPTKEECEKTFPEIAEQEKSRERKHHSSYVTNTTGGDMTSLRNERDALRHENQTLRDENETLRAQIAALTQDPDGDTQSDQEQTETPAKPAKQRGGRRSKK